MNIIDENPQKEAVNDTVSRDYFKTAVLKLIALHYLQVRMTKLYEDILLKLPWIERLDLTNDLVPVAPELAVQLERHEQKRANEFKGNKKIPYVTPEADPVINDFKREILFYRQAQSAAIEGIKKLHELNISTKRPDDYFAEMAKTDEHMQRIRTQLVAKQEGQVKSERIRQLREQKKIGKLLQREATLKKQEEKRKMMDDLKAFRKGKLKNLDFLDDERDAAPKKKTKDNKKTRGKPNVSTKRKARDDKFGFGGRKKGSKRNTADSHLEKTPKALWKKSQKVSVKRLGKNRRGNIKNRKK